jgi:arylsulfatase A-like enzyme
VYSETPLCCPGRASFLTGQHTRHHGVVVNDARLLDPRHTIAVTLHDAGYHTMMVGKYLNGAAQLTDHTPPGWDQVAMLNDWSSNQSSDWWVQDVPVTDGYYDRFIDGQATSWLSDAPADQPVFMWVTPHAPHKSAAATQPWEPDIEPQFVGDPRCSGIKPWSPPDYLFAGRPDGYPLDDICRSLLTVDDMVGDLQRAAAAQGRDPVWVFTSDNGMAWGANGYVLKNVPEADRLPYFMSGPGVEQGRTDALISNIDIAPTLADLAGTDMPTADGKSFARVLSGGRGVRSSLLEDHPVGGPTGEGDVATGPWWGVRTPRWHLIVWNAIRLYDVQADPWEMKDVAADHPDVVQQLEGIYNRPLPSPTPSETPAASLPPTPTPALTPTPTLTLAPTPSDTATTPTPSATSSVVLESVVPTAPDSVAASSPPTSVRPKKSDADGAARSPSPVVDAVSATPPSDTSPLGSVVTIAFIALAIAGVVGMLIGHRLMSSQPPRS